MCEIEAPEWKRCGVGEVDVAEAGVADETDARADEGVGEAVEYMDGGKWSDEVGVEVFPAEGEGVRGRFGGGVEVGVTGLVRLAGG